MRTKMRSEVDVVEYSGGWSAEWACAGRDFPSGGVAPNGPVHCYLGMGEYNRLLLVLLVDQFPASLPLVRIFEMLKHVRLSLQTKRT